MLSSAAVIIPTWNALRYWTRLHDGLQAQNLSNEQVFVVDSSSNDSTQELVRRPGYRLKVIPQDSFPARRPTPSSVTHDFSTIRHSRK